MSTSESARKFEVAWVKDDIKPTKPLSPSQQKIVDSYYQNVVGCLEGTGQWAEHHVGHPNPTRGEADRALSEFAGYSDFMNIWSGARGDNRSLLIRALGQVISKAPEHPIATGQVIDLADSQMDIAQLHDDIRLLSRTPFASENKFISQVITEYKQRCIARDALSSLSTPHP